MSGVFQNIDPPHPPHRPASARLWCGGGHTRWVEGGGGANVLENARHSTVLYICKYTLWSDRCMQPIHMAWLKNVPCSPVGHFYKKITLNYYKNGNFCLSLLIPMLGYNTGLQF